MGPSPLIAALAGVLVGAVITLVVIAAWRFAHGSRELGSDSERATYRALHAASLAAEHLRGGLADADALRAARHLRTLLGCETLAIADPSGAIAIDGVGEVLRPFLESLIAGSPDVLRTRVLEVPDAPGVSQLWAIVAPIVVDEEVAGLVVAFSATKHAPLVRATGEVAAWVSAQIRIGELDASRTALAEAQLRALRSQISPHFVYNALNAIAAFIITDPPHARELVLEFADFTRYSFRRAGNFTTVAEELRSIHSYLALERARFGERLQVSLQVAPETLSAVIPFLSMQPLIENAVRHGLEAREEGGRLSVRIDEIGADVRILVEDNGVGMDPSSLADLLDGQDDGQQVGIRNVDTRLRRVYGEAYALVFETNPGAGTLVRMTVPRSQPLHDTDRAETPVGVRS